MVDSVFVPKMAPKMTMDGVRWVFLFSNFKADFFPAFVQFSSGICSIIGY